MGYILGGIFPRGPFTGERKPTSPDHHLPAPRPPPVDLISISAEPCAVGIITHLGQVKRLRLGKYGGTAKRRGSQQRHWHPATLACEAQTYSPQQTTLHRAEETQHVFPARVNDSVLETLAQMTAGSMSAPGVGGCSPLLWLKGLVPGLGPTILSLPAFAPRLRSRCQASFCAKDDHPT